MKAGDRRLRGKKIRLIFDNEGQAEILDFEQALSRAEETGQDLVEVSPNAEPPVCRIMDFGKFQYEQSKRQRDAKKKQHQQKVKEIKFHPNIDTHDYETKVNHAVAFLGKGNKVKISMYFRGREMAHAELGHELMKRIIEDTKDVGIVDATPRQTGRLISMMLAPKGRK